MTLAEFFHDNGINPNTVSKTVYKMMDVKEYDEEVHGKTLGGYLRTLYVQNGGTTVLPSEYFGRNSKSYVPNVSARNISDATPTITRPAMAATFKGGAKRSNKKYTFLNVSDLKKFSKFANKKDKEYVNEMLSDVFSNAIKNKKITVKSLKDAFMK